MNLGYRESIISIELYHPTFTLFNFFYIYLGPTTLTKQLRKRRYLVWYFVHDGKHESKHQAASLTLCYEIYC